MIKPKIIIPKYTLSEYVNDIGGPYKQLLTRTGMMELGAVGAGRMAPTVGIGAGIVIGLMEGGVAAAEGLVTAAVIGGVAGGAIGAAYAFFGEYEGATGTSIIYYKHSGELSEKALEGSLLFESLKNKGNGLSKQGNSIITPEVISGLEKSIEDTPKPNVAGINEKFNISNIQYKVPEYLSDLPNSPLEGHILKKLSHYQN
jgi:hypothetical protein